MPSSSTDVRLSIFGRSHLLATSLVMLMLLALGVTKPSYLSGREHLDDMKEQVRSLDKNDDFLYKDERQLNIGMGLTSVFYKENGGHRMVEAIFAYNRDNASHEIVNCYLYGDTQVINSVLYFVPPFMVRFVDNKQIKDLISTCESVFQESPLAKPPSIVSILADPEQFAWKPIGGLVIYPGTKWCGMGTIADDYDDLGTEAETDKCCREHDHCFDSIPAGGSKHGLTNNAVYTKSHCWCDYNFTRCLQDTQTETSNNIGIIYFNILQIQCFKLERPIIACLKSWGLTPLSQSCQKYKLDHSKPEKWQFFDALMYRPIKKMTSEVAASELSIYDLSK